MTREERRSKAGKIARRTWWMNKANLDRFGYGLLTVGVIVGLFAGWKNDNAIKEVNEKQTKFILEQCRRDDMRNDIVVDSLEGAKRRAAVTYKSDPFLAQIEISKINEQIASFTKSPKCELP